MYVFSAELYCDSCGEAIAAQCRFDTGDSDDFPQWASEGESDSPQHCASGHECLESIDLAAYGLKPDAVLYGAETRAIGALLETLTPDGEAYLAEMLAEPVRTPYQRALHTLWREEFSIEEEGC